MGGASLPKKYNSKIKHNFINWKKTIEPPMKIIQLLLVTLVASEMNNTYSASVCSQEIHDAGPTVPQEEMTNCKKDDDVFALTGGACYIGAKTTENHDRRNLGAYATSYSVLFYGSSYGYSDNRAQIQLRGSSGVVAWIRFKDEGQMWEDDYEQGGIIRMHMPSHMFPNVIEMLENAVSIYIYMAQGRAFLSII